MKLLTAVLFASLALIGCDKDEDNGNNESFLKIGSREYNLSAGTLENYGQDSLWHNGYNTDLLLYSDGLSIKIDEDEEWELTGKGHAIYFEMFSNSGSSLDNGEYVYSSDEPFEIGTFGFSAYSINYNSETDDVEKDEEIVSGKVTVSKNGNQYNITFDCIDENGDEITGLYKGSLRYFDWSDDLQTISLTTIKHNKNKIK